MWTSAQLSSFLSTVTLAPEIASLRPDYRVLLLALSNLPANGPGDSTSETLLTAAESSARSTHASAATIPESPHIAAWREAYKAFGTKPNKFRNSLEALTRRAITPAGLPRVNRLTDVYNAISVSRQIPLGVEDLDRYVGAPVLKRATGEERFETREGGEEVVEKPEKGEVVWCDEAGVTCRRWNWRQGSRTALGEGTRSVIVIADALEPFGDQELEALSDELVEQLAQGPEGVRVAKRIIKAQ